MSATDLAVLRLEQSRQKMAALMTTPGASINATSLAFAAGNLLVQPTVRKHPLGTVLAAAAIGAVLYKIRPWRLLNNPIALSVLAPLAISKIGLLAPSSEPALLKGFDLYRQFLQSRPTPKGK
jgi:hypothetical protein